MKIIIKEIEFSRITDIIVDMAKNQSYLFTALKEDYQGTGATSLRKALIEKFVEIEKGEAE